MKALDFHAFVNPPIVREQSPKFEPHMHPPPGPGSMPPQGPPGAMGPDMPGPIESIPVDRMNEMYMQQNQAVNDRLEADGRGYDSVFAQ
ncbi:MAG: hypothetical protein M1827_001357 [Pycnora praestabilis]|nr:MAG: hypothetical protein M1827_001357 [Pycnora praestabilis]